MYSPLRGHLGLEPIYPPTPFVYLSNETLVDIATSPYTTLYEMQQLALYLLSVIPALARA